MVLLQSFGRHFERYEQHCALDRYNANFLNKAMQNPDFSMYLKVRPRAIRADLRDNSMQACSCSCVEIPH